MIIIADDDDEYEALVRQLRIINSMRPHRFARDNHEDTPWIQTRRPRPEYL